MNPVISIIAFITIMSKPMCAILNTHIKCRGGIYPRSSIQRFEVPDDKVSWSVEFREYNPPKYTSPSIKGKPWADFEIDDPKFKPQWNSIDGNVNRISYVGKYEIVNGFPQNPFGRTGIIGRGNLGRWGPNHAADPVVTKWKKQPDGNIEHHADSKSPILQFVAIQRGDTGEWALPGGMVDPGEKVSAAAIREFQEEATNSLAKSEEEKEEWRRKFTQFFSKGESVFSGYVDDPRNTDNSWMETVALNFHDVTGDTVGLLNLNAGDDAVGVRWVDMDSNLKLYASHKEIVQAVAEKLNAHWNH